MQEKFLVEQKTWGHEEIHENNNKYAFKTLWFKPNSHCSLHAHKSKKETFLLLDGSCIIETVKGKIKSGKPKDLKYEKKEIHFLNTLKDKLTIEPETFHKVITQEGCVLLEVSTTDSAEDNYRAEPTLKEEKSKCLSKE